MTSRDFAYWLQGFFELRKLEDKQKNGLTAAQAACIQNHLNMVYEIDPSMGDEAHQRQLGKIHGGGLSEVLDLDDYEPPRGGFIPSSPHNLIKC